jgi:hypothetical protein
MRGIRDHLRGGALFALILAGAGAPAAAQEAVIFDLSIRGLPVGTVSFAGQQTGRRYAVTGKLETSGLAAMIRTMRYEGVAKGSVAGRRFTPARYVETANTGKRRSEGVMEYRRGVPQVKSYNPPRAAGDGGVDPATQGGTVDPLTALFATLRDVPQGQECNLALKLFDGKRGSRITLGAPTAVDGGVTCPGEYRRVAGFSAEDMAEKTRFPFTVTLVPDGTGMMRVSDVAMDSLYGKARLTRR